MVFGNYYSYANDGLISRRITKKIKILDLARFIDYCKKNRLDYKKIILDNL